MFLGLRTVIYPTNDLPATRAFFSHLLATDPYFDEPFYVGFNIGGYELGIDPDADVARGPVVYWGVADADDALAELVSREATIVECVNEVGGNIRVATVVTPEGFLLGIIENPHFKALQIQTTGPGK